MPRPVLPISYRLRILILWLFASFSATSLSAAGPKPSKYPLRVHVLIADESFRTPRMSPGLAAACDSVDGVVSSISLGSVSLTGFGGDPCSFGPDFMRGGMLDNSDDAPAFSGSGRGDLVSPPRGTQGLSFRYDNCSRVRANPGFYSLDARWKKPGQKLEVLIPSDAIPTNNRPLPPERCTFTVTLKQNVYLLLHNGKLVEVSQQDYWAKPALRVFLSGGSAPTIQQRVKQMTIPAHPGD